jgi:hypothetical protein
MKGLASELSALGKPVEDDELLGYLLHGLDKVEYNPLITSVNGNPGTSLYEFYEQLCSYDMHNGVEDNATFISSANLARRGTDTSRELLIASLLIAGALVFYVPVVKIPPANTSIFAGGKSYHRRTALSCASDNNHTTGA